uniref:E3 ubiquitin-protein ligase ZFP91 n=1 Tax=Gasterosteus aculeatus aculeatus TaxID=481459 RepID=A0AAQ4RT72_GASAC
MEPAGDRTGGVNKGDEPAQDKATERTAATSLTVTPRRGLRERGACRSRTAVRASLTEVNGAASGPQSSGRVLRDRSTRAVPAWLKDTKSEDEDEPSPDTGATKRRKVSNPRRKKPSECGEAGGGVAGDRLRGTDSGDPKKPATDAPALPSTRRPPAQSRAKPPSARAVRGSAKPVCKTEPGTENPAAEKGEVETKDRYEIQKKEEGTEDLTEPVSDDEDPPLGEDLDDLRYQPQSPRYAPLRDVSKPKRRAPLRAKERKEKERALKSEKEVAEIKVEGLDNVESLEEEVKLEEEPVDDPDGPRKRGRRKKDDKTPRLPKRRKKPPVQYVRCEMEGCGTVLAHPRYLQHHIKYQHLLKKKYVCPHPSCGRLFRLQKQLLRHAKHHTDQRDYICEFCARAFKSSHNLAVHRMIHTGEKPLQCEICGFTCRQKASLNWHMKKHDADATYQFACSICGKKFEKKDCVVAHKAKSHPEVLIAEALAANAGALITTPASLLELQGNPVPAEPAGLDVHHMGHGGQVEQLSQQVSHQVVLLGQDQSLHTMQVPVTIALSAINPPLPAESHQQTHLQLQMPVQFVHAAPQPQIQQLTLHPGQVVTPHQPQLHPLQAYSSQQQGQTQILQMTFQPLSQSQTHVQQVPIQSTAQQLRALDAAAVSSPLLAPPPPQDAASSNGDSFILDHPVLSSSSPSTSSLAQTDAMGGDGVAWGQEGHEDVLSDSVERQSLM